MTEAWSKGQRDIPPIDEKQAKAEIHKIKAKVLSNRKPPYSLTGGVFDVLSASAGAMYAVDNDEVERAMDLFEKHEKSDIHPAGGVARGALMQAIERKAVKSDDIIALNITGGGEKRIKAEVPVHYLEPYAQFNIHEIHSEGIEEKIESVLHTG